MSSFLGVFVGGLTGASVRWALFEAYTISGNIPWHIVAVNTFSCALLAVVLSQVWSHPKIHMLLHDVLGIGFCGGLSTMSSVAVATSEISRTGNVFSSIPFIAISLFLGFSVYILCILLFQKIKTFAMPLEEEP